MASNGLSLPFLFGYRPHQDYPLTMCLVAASLLLQIWQTNAFKLACSTVFTLFWAGRDFAPKALIDGKNIQDWLQEHYLGAFGALYVRSPPPTFRHLPSLCFTDNMTCLWYGSQGRTYS